MEKTQYTASDLQQKSYIDLLKLGKRMAVKMHNPKKQQLIELILEKQGQDNSTEIKKEIITSNQQSESDQGKPNKSNNLQEMISTLSKKDIDVMENSEINKSSKMRLLFDLGKTTKEVCRLIEHYTGTKCHYSFAYGVRCRMKEK